MNSTFTQNKIEAVQQKLSIHISIDKLSRGLDNYHIDIKLSRGFSSDIRKLIALLVSQIAVPKPKHWDNSRGFEKIRESYLDIMTVLIHRVKTDLSADEISLLQFTPIKHILKSTRSKLDDEIKHVNSRLTEHRNKGSSEALATDQRLFWLKKNYDAILYQINKTIFNQLRRVEERQLGAIRSQYLGEEYNYCADAIINPLLYTSKLSALPLLLREYSGWSWNSEDSDFVELNGKVEAFFSKRITKIETKSIRESQNPEALEIHDDFGGLFQVQSFLGTAADTKSQLYEDFYWLDQPAKIELLFDSKRHAKELSENRKDLGFRIWWRCRSEIKELKKTLSAFSKLLRADGVLPQLLASHYMRKSLNPLIMELVDLKIICQFLCGHITSDKLQSSISGGVKLNNE